MGSLTLQYLPLSCASHFGSSFRISTPHVDGPFGRNEPGSTIFDHVNNLE